MRATTRRGDRKKYSRARMRRARARERPNARRGGGGNADSPRMHDVVAPPFQKIIHQGDPSRASSHTSARGRPARWWRRARERSAAHRRRRRLRRVSRVSRARENDDEGTHAMSQPIATSTWISSPISRESAMATTTTSSCSTPTLTSTREDAKATRRAMGGMMMTPTPTRRNRPAAAASRRR